MIYTFYSFKGGVGRSMALANVAELLYQNGLSVLVVDWDLEAPGLERYFSIPIDRVLDHAGIMEMLLDYKQRMSRPPALGTEAGEMLLPLDGIEPYILRLHPDEDAKGRLWIIPSGRRAGKHFTRYSAMVRAFDWRDFYRNWEGELFFEWMRQQFLELADVVLIDSRTGVAEIGGVCTYQLADAVIMFCSANQQSLDGTYEMAENFTTPEVRELRRGRDLRVLIVPARVEDRAETKLLTEFQRNFTQRFGQFLPVEWKDKADYFWQLKIPHVPYFAFNEAVAVRERDEARSEDMVRSFQSLAREMAKAAPVDTPMKWIVRDRSIQYDVFISYVRADEGWLREFLFDAFDRAGIKYISEKGLEVGASYLTALERAIKQSRRTILVVSPRYLASNCYESICSALFEVYGREVASWPVVPIVVEPTPLPPRLSMLVTLDATSPALSEEAIDRLCTDLQHPTSGPPAKPPCPYPGMVPFSAKDARYFYGRDAEIQELLRSLRHQNCLFAIGPSSCGKSSLIFAGLIPRLQEGYLGPWLVRSMRPGSHPMETLSEALGVSLSDASHSVEAYDSLIASMLTKNKAAQRLLLVIDQFEDLFTLVDDRNRAAFIAALKLLQGVKAFTLLVAMRADFYADLMTSELWPVHSSQRIEIAPLRGEALRQAIQRPAEDAGVHFEAGLLERLLADAADEPGVLSLLQETMVLLWGQMQGRLLPLSAYERLGGVKRTGLAVAIAEKADATLSRISPEQQAITRRIFLRLVQFGEGRADTRRQQNVAALRAADDDPRLFEETLRNLVENRLLITSGEEVDPDRQVDLAHEALIQGWPTLQQWLAERREAEQTRRQLEAKSAEWIRLGRGKAGLLDEVELFEAEQWLASPDAAELGYSESLIELVEASGAEVRLLKRRAYRWYWVVAALVISIVVNLVSFLVIFVLGK